MMKYFSAGSFISGVIVGVLLSGAWFFGGTGSTSLPRSLSTDTTTPIPESGAISVIDQPAGTTVIVASSTVPAPGAWIAVRELNGNDLGNVLGAARIGGPQTAIDISLLRATAPGRRYAIELYRDDDNGAFDVGVNSVYIDFDTRAPVIAYFTTTE